MSEMSEDFERMLAAQRSYDAALAAVESAEAAFMTHVCGVVFDNEAGEQTCIRPIGHYEDHSVEADDFGSASRYHHSARNLDHAVREVHETWLRLQIIRTRPL